MANRDRPHLVVTNPPAPEPFTLSGAGGSSELPPFGGNRRAHGSKLKLELENSLGSPESGTYITFESFPGLNLALDSLDPRRSDQPKLISVADRTVEGELVQLATVHIPAGQQQYFVDKIDAYISSSDRIGGRPKNTKLVEGIAAIRRATIRELWTDPISEFPTDNGSAHWWEVWLRNGDGNERARLDHFAQIHDLRTSKHYLGFGDRTVILLQATVAQLADDFNTLDDLAELRRPHATATFLAGMSASEQAEWVDELAARLTPTSADAPAVCLLDTGIQQDHPLLADSLAADDVHVADPSWRPAPTAPHGTEMAGLALFGDLQSAIESADEVRLHHRLESVKFLPHSGSNDPDSYGAITARSVDQPEIQAADRARVFMLAITAPGSDTERTDDAEPGRPTPWSSALDSLAFGDAINDVDPDLTVLDPGGPRHPRLFVVSAGNIRDIVPTDDHLDRSDLEPVEDPAQAWNAITVGAYTEQDDMSGAPDGFDGYVPIAVRGELSPTSRTSVRFDPAKWPFKPDVVASGGNVARSPDGTSADTPDNLALLTTRFRHPGQGYFTTARDTSAATAQVAAIAADLRAQYPALRPETVRALIVQSAEWTDPMLGHFNADTNKASRSALLRRYGMGVPDLARATQSATDALTLIAQARIRPYVRERGEADATVREMNLHELPWPTTELEMLGEAQVRLRVTLSYFVQPNPSRRGWTGRYAYPSHGLRFAMRRSDENVTDFRTRINKKARDESWVRVERGTEPGWFFGANQQQSAGSLHTDIWTGSAVDLASKGAIAVYPVAGWWKHRRSHDQSDLGVDYALIVSIESPEVEIDLYTPVAQQIAQSVAVET